MEALEKLEASLEAKSAALEVRLALLEAQPPAGAASGAAGAAAAAAAGGAAQGKAAENGTADLKCGRAASLAGDAGRALAPTVVEDARIAQLAEQLAERLQVLERRVEGLAAALERQQQGPQ